MKLPNNSLLLGLKPVCQTIYITLTKYAFVQSLSLHLFSLSIRTCLCKDL